MLVVGDAWHGTAQERLEGALARLDRLPCQVDTIELEQIERAKHGIKVCAALPDQLEHGHPGFVADDRLAVDHA